MSNEYLNNNLDVKFSDFMVTIIDKANKDLGHTSISQTVDNMLCAGVILDSLLDEYPQVEAAYEDYKAKTLAARGNE
jgi:hypothetical protein